MAQNLSVRAKRCSQLLCFRYKQVQYSPNRLGRKYIWIRYTQGVCCRVAFDVYTLPWPNRRSNIHFVERMIKLSVISIRREDCSVILEGVRRAPECYGLMLYGYDYHEICTGYPPMVQRVWCLANQYSAANA